MWGASDRLLAAYRAARAARGLRRRGGVRRSGQFTLEGRRCASCASRCTASSAAAGRSPSARARRRRRLEPEMTRSSAAGARASAACSGSRWAWAPTSPTSAPRPVLLARSPEGDLGPRCGSSPTAEALARHDAPPWRHAERAQRGAGLPGARGCARAWGKARSASTTPVSRTWFARVPAARRPAVGALMVVLGRRFQMERLVRFNEKFAPRVAAALSGLRDPRRAAPCGRASPPGRGLRP